VKYGVKSKLITLIIFMLHVSMYAESINFSLNPLYDITQNTYKITMKGLYDSKYLQVGGDAYIANDNFYYDPTHYRFYFGGYFNVKEGFVKFNINKFTVKAGRLILKDFVDSPYSVFLSGAGISAPSILFSYSSENFFYRTQWILLSKNVPNFNHLDRGVVFKTYGIKIGKIRFAFQDSIVYANRLFDYEYFFSPIPSFLTQYTLYANKPFYQSWDDNSLMGFFADYHSKELYLYAQILIDDLNMNRFYGGFQNPDKIAWSVGGKIKTKIGEFGLYHAGATKYTFESRAFETGYVLFPESVVTVHGGTRTLLPEENYVGFKYGENTLAFFVTYSNYIMKGSLDVSLEYILSGPKSYNNPWQDLSTCPEYTHLLDDPKIDKTSKLYASYSREFFKNFLIYTSVSYIDIKNKLEALPTADGGDYVLKPTNENENKISLVIGFSLKFDLLKLF